MRAQDSLPGASLVRVGAIHLSGNKKTKSAVIYRELAFRSGDSCTLEELVSKMELSRQQLMNSTLFNEVIVAAREIRGQLIDIGVELKERWYIVPVPYAKPVDRNWNQWLVEQKARLDRVNYGVKLFYNNTTGHNDKFRLWLLNGYTKQVSFHYDRLYLDNNLKWGFRLLYAMGKNREVNYRTLEGKQAFFKNPDQYLRHFTSASAELTYRPAIRTRHSFGIGFTTERISDTVSKLNPDYLPAGRTRTGFPGLYYSLYYYSADYVPYPTQGAVALLTLSKLGLGSRIHMWQLQARSSQSWKWSPRSFFNLQLYGGLKLPFRQPFFNQRFLGYQDLFLQGFEYYVVDGVAGGYAKATAARELAAFFLRTAPGKKGKTRLQIPFRVYGKLYGNAGYVHHPDPGPGSLSNQWLYSGGLGIDIVTFYDVVIKLEWSFNSLGENGLFLHRKTNF